MVNLTNQYLQPAQQKVLRLGRNFSPAPRKIPIKDTIIGIEAAARRLPEEEANDLQVCICGILRRAMSPKKNITREQEKALRYLRDMKDEIILPVDKGNMAVVMSKTDYHQKLMDLINTPTYVAITRDPTAAQERKIRTKLLELKKKGKYPKDLYNILRPSGSLLPRIYGLPKVHKPSVLLQPA